MRQGKCPDRQLRALRFDLVRDRRQRVYRHPKGGPQLVCSATVGDQRGSRKALSDARRILRGWRPSRDGTFATTCSHALAFAVMPTDPKSKPLPVRVPRDLIARIDALRGLVPRETYIRDLLGRSIAAEERKAAKR